jgi:low affinity Fe/Cu permease
MLNDVFRHFANKVSVLAGKPYAFFLALIVILVWIITGPIFGFSDTWQLVINTGTTIVTFLMVFLIQNTQNRDAKAVHIKLDELLKAMKGARNSLVSLENMPDVELDELEAEFSHLHDYYVRLAKKNRRLAKAKLQRAK